MENKKCGMDNCGYNGKIFFIDFLLSTRLVESFYHNVRLQGNCTRFERDFVDGDEGVWSFHPINKYFFWNGTEEGFMYWKFIDMSLIAAYYYIYHGDRGMIKQAMKQLEEVTLKDSKLHRFYILFKRFLMKIEMVRIGRNKQ